MRSRKLFLYTQELIAHCFVYKLFLSFSPSLNIPTYIYTYNNLETVFIHKNYET